MVGWIIVGFIIAGDIYGTYLICKKINKDVIDEINRVE